jgi:hypothetical protein
MSFIVFDSDFQMVELNGIAIEPREPIIITSDSETEDQVELGDSASSHLTEEGDLPENNDAIVIESDDSLGSTNSSPLPPAPTENERENFWSRQVTVRIPLGPLFFANIIANEENCNR